MEVQISLIALGCAVFTMNKHFCHRTFRVYRAALYAGLGLTAVVFVVHGILLHGYDVQRKLMALDWMAMMGTLNFLGAAVYAARVRFTTLKRVGLYAESDRSRRDGTHIVSTSLVRVTRLSMSWCSWLRWHMWRGFTARIKVLGAR